ncbi:MAG TPA: hypothetical protein VGL60_06675 [Acidimicrobiales bacterium]|jgi:hypothetical protein
MTVTTNYRGGYLGTGRASMPVRLGRVGLGGVGLLMVVVGAWGGIVPFLGPAIGFSGDGSGSWNLDASHAAVGLAPGAVAVVIGLLLVAEAPRVIVGRGRGSLTMAGLLAVACGAWFVVGPLAWPVLQASRPYFVGAGALRELAYQVGYALGPGGIVIACGAFAVGWASRHREVGLAGGSAPEPAVPVAPAQPVAE